MRRPSVINRQDKLVGLVTVDDLSGPFAQELFNVAHAREPSFGEQA